jgi:hypothetical protein
VLFFTFLAAILTMVLAVWLAAAVGQWWILIPVVAVDLIVTTAVMGVVIWMLADGANPAQPDIRSLTPVPGLERDPDGNEYAQVPAHAAQVERAPLTHSREHSSVRLLSEMR